ncbi:unnamed protein product, partial [Ectocarpus sp. 12 AP-2014]
MSLHGGSVFSRLSKQSAIRDTTQLAVHLSNDNAMRRLLRDGVGINEMQKKYLSLCYSARPAVRPNKDVAQSLGGGELVWNLTACEKQETAIIASLLMTKEARTELLSLVISAHETGRSSSVRKRAGAATTGRRGSRGSRGGGSREMAMERDPVGEVELFNALCKAFPQLKALRSLELEGLRKAFEMSKASGSGPARLARGLARNTGLKSLAVRHVRLTDSRALGALSTAISVHPSLVALSLRGCGLVGEASGRLVSSVLRAHAARREGLVWSTGLRRPTGVVGHTAAAAPARISTAGCLAVDLSDNRLGDAGVHAVARGLQSDTWLLGVNLARNGITDHGAALLSVCLQHNATLCALVLDGNPEVGHGAERRITEELETRSMMPEAVLEEPEVVLTLASWGFSAHTGVDRDLSPPTRPAAAVAGSGSVVSEISQDSFGGGGGNLGGDGFGGATRRGGAASGASAAIPTSVQAKTPAERKEEMVREFRQWAGYTPCSMRGPGSHGTGLVDPSTAEATATAPPASGHEGGTVGRRPGRGRRSTAVLLRAESGAGAPAAEAPRGGGRREGAATSSRAHARPPRARSLSSRSPGAGAAAAMARAAAGSDSSSAGGGRLAKKNKWSGGACSSGRVAEREREQTPELGKKAGLLREKKAPWGAGPGKGEVRERTQAWANAHLADRTGRLGGYSSVGSGSWRNRVRSRKGHVSTSGC